MSEETNFTIRLSKAAKEFNVGMGTILDFLAKKGFQVDSSPNTKLTSEMYALLVKEYQGEREVKNEAKKLGDLSYKGGSVSVDSTVQSPVNTIEDDDTDEVFIRTSTLGIKTPITKPAEESKKTAPVAETAEPEKDREGESHGVESSIKVVGKIDLDSLNTKTRPDKKQKADKQAEKKETDKAKTPSEKDKKVEKPEEAKTPEHKQEAKKPETEAAKTEAKKVETTPAEPKFIKTEVKKLDGPKILDKIELPEERKRSKQQPVASSEGSADSKKKTTFLPNSPNEASFSTL